MEWVWIASGATGEWIASLDWEPFFPTLLATVVGAPIGVFGSGMGFYCNGTPTTSPASIT